MTHDLPLFDRHASEQARDEAIGRVERHADAAWKAEALEAVKGTASRNAFLTSDDVWQRLTTRPHEPRAMGAIMRHAVTLGWIAPTERFIPTLKASQHRQPIRVWKSLLIQEVA